MRRLDVGKCSLSLLVLWVELKALMEGFASTLSFVSVVADDEDEA